MSLIFCEKHPKEAVGSKPSAGRRDIPVCADCVTAEGLVPQDEESAFPYYVPPEYTLKAIAERELLAAYDRPLLFRAWDGSAMHSVQEAAAELWPVLLGPDGGAWTIMQFTGLRDRNGRDIYEGDVVEAWSQGSRGTFEVRWRQQSSPCFMLWPAWQPGTGRNDLWHLHGSKDKDGGYSDTVAVLGNVFENPELRPKR